MGIDPPIAPLPPITNRWTLELGRLQRDSHDSCCLCDKKFFEGDTVHAGYAQDGRPLYVGGCCQSQLIETAARIHWKPRAYELPKPGAFLWRYMDFAKFVTLLRDKALYFSRADCLGDR